jgi:FAD/FMN-containing dehydrogenase
VRQFHARKAPFRIYHGSTNSTRPLAFRRDQMIDLSDFSHVLKVDRDARTVLVEPNVPMDQLVEATLEHGLVPPVVMEFPGITVGGGFAGSGGESSSFRYGLFDRTVNWIEIVLANGEVVVASDRERADLFYGAAGTFGTLGVVTLLELQLIEARRYVELTYFPVSSVAAALETVAETVKNPSIDYLDGILFAANRGVIITGRLTDTVNKDIRVQRFTRARDPWFYLNAEDIWKKSPTTPTIEAVPLVDYLFRYDRGAFWTGSYAFRYFITPFNRFSRWLLDGFMRTRVMYHALHESGLSDRYIVQDLAVPHSAAEQFIDYVDETLGCYPLWICPLRPHDRQRVSLHPQLTSTSSTSRSTDGEMMLNVGVWGPGPARHQDFVQTNRSIEHKVNSLHGTKWLYAHAYYTEDEFWSIYDRSWYDGLRAKYDATSLPSVYEKVRLDPDAHRRALGGVLDVWPLTGLYGVYKTLFGGSYLLADERGKGRIRLAIGAVLVAVVATAVKAKGLVADGA